MSIWDNPVAHADLLKRIWTHLDLGVIQRKHPFHSAVFGTVDGGFASTRTVILRRFWRKPPSLAFHSHIGSPKIKQIEVNPNATWLFYHPDEKLQLRIRGVAKVHTTDELADEQWTATAKFSRRCYIGVAPSQYSKKPTSGMPPDLTGREPTPEESEVGRENFCVISTSIDHIDCVELDFHGHRRAYFSWDAEGQSDMGWLTP
jgi:hypothetical protein